MKRLSTRLVLSHLLVAIVGALTAFVVVRALAPGLFEDAAVRAGYGYGLGAGGERQGQGGAHGSGSGQGRGTGQGSGTGEGQGQGKGQGKGQKSGQGAGKDTGTSQNLDSSSTRASDPIPYTPSSSETTTVRNEPPRQGQGNLRTVFADAVDSALIVGSIVALAVALILSLVTVRRLLRSVNKLRKATGKIAQGDYLEPIETPSETELAELAKDISSLGKSLAETEQRRVQLLSEVAHEMRTPLTVIEGNVEGMIDGVFETTPERLALISGEVSRLRRLSGDLSNLSRGEEGRWNLHLGLHDVDQVVRTSIERLRPQFEHQQVDLSSTGSIGQLLIDPDRIAQVVTNILGNALRATPSGGRVSVELIPANTTHLNQLDSEQKALGQRDSAESAFNQIRITDTGIGLSQEECDRVFERFYRGSSSKPSDGSGIGLTIARSLIRAHGGDLKAESPGLGQGSTFVVTLPSPEAV